MKRLLVISGASLDTLHLQDQLCPVRAAAECTPRWPPVVVESRHRCLPLALTPVQTVCDPWQDIYRSGWVRLFPRSNYQKLRFPTGREKPNTSTSRPTVISQSLP
jgi:hypothetical protein